MKTIGLVPGAMKPYTAGHDGLVRIAAGECDEVHLFVSTGDRVRPGEIPIFWSDMSLIWKKFIEPSLPPNVVVSYVKVPVSAVFDDIKEGEESGEDVAYKIYSDEEDVLKYSDTSLKKIAPKLFKKKRIARRGVKRTETVNISGTKMRKFISDGDVKSFISFLPQGVQKNGKKIFTILKKGALAESLLRTYIQTIVND